MRLRGGGSSGSAGPPPDPKAVTQPRGLGGEGHEPALLVFIYLFFFLLFLTLYFFNFFFFSLSFNLRCFPVCLSFLSSRPPRTPQSSTALTTRTYGALRPRYCKATRSVTGTSQFHWGSNGSQCPTLPLLPLSHTFIPPYPVMECDFGRPGASCSRLAPVAAQFSMWWSLKPTL